MRKSNNLENLLACAGLFFIIVSLCVYLYFLGGISRMFRIPIVMLLTAALVMLIVSHIFWKVSSKDIKFHWIFLLTIPFIIFNFIGAISPVTDTDGAGYHLAMPKIYLQNDKFIYHPNVISNWPMSGEMLYVPLMYFGLPPKLIHSFFGIMLALLIYCIAKRYFDHKVAAWASVITYTIPMVVLESGIAYVDLFFSFYIIFGLYYAYRAIDERSSWLPILSSILLGFGASIKWNGPVFVILTFILLMSMHAYKNRDLMLLIKKSWWWYPLPGIFFCGLWYVKNWLLSGAPFIPFTTGTNWSADNVALYMKTIAAPHINYLTDIIAPFTSLTTEPFKFGELTWIGPIFLAFLVAPIFVKLILVDREKVPQVIKAMLLFSFIFYIIWLIAMPQSRLLLPILAVLTIPIAWIIKKNKFYKAMVLISILSALPFAILYHGAYARNFEDSATYKMYDDLRIQHQLGYKLNSTILVYGDVHTYYLDYDYVWARPDMQGWITNYSDLKSYGITHVLIAQEDNPFPDIKKQILSNNLTPIEPRDGDGKRTEIYEVR